MEKSVLRLEYERIRGEVVSDRQWLRIRHVLAITADWDDSRIVDVQNYARLRKLNPRAKIGLKQVRQLSGVLELLANARSGADDLWLGIEKMLPVTPSERTVYRWGTEIGVPYSRSRVYTRLEMQAWICKLFGVRERYMRKSA